MHVVTVEALTYTIDAVLSRAAACRPTDCRAHLAAAAHTVRGAHTAAGVQRAHRGEAYKGDGIVVILWIYSLERNKSVQEISASSPSEDPPFKVSMRLFEVSIPRSEASIPFFERCSQPLLRDILDVLDVTELQETAHQVLIEQTAPWGQQVFPHTMPASAAGRGGLRRRRRT